MDKIQINASEGTSEVIIREGKAVEVFPQKSLEIQGTLKAPADFLEHKLVNYENVKCHLRVKNSSGELQLFLNEKDGLRDVITGKITLNPVIAEFGVNNDHKWGINELRQFVQRKSFWFDTKDEYNKMLTSLQKFKTSVVKIYQNQQSNDGNSKLVLENQVQEANIINSFKLKMPIYLGYEEKSFNVEIGLDVSSAETRLFLFSEELFHLQEELRVEYIESEIKRFTDFMDFGNMSIVNID